MPKAVKIMRTFKDHRINNRMARGFTLVELLVVIAIVLILAAVVVLILQPVEIRRRDQDSSRLADLSNLNTAINNAVAEASGSAEAILCKGGSYPCSGSSYPVEGTTRNSDGNGWLKVDLSEKLPNLYVDPVNDSVYHYSYCADNDAWELNATLESERDKTRMAEDSGDQNATDIAGKYEVGTNLTLINSSGSPCTY